MRPRFVVSYLATRLRHKGILSADKSSLKNNVSRGSKVELIHKRLAAYERAQLAVAVEESKFKTASIAAENLIKNSNKYDKVLQRRELEQETVIESNKFSNDNDVPLAAKPIGEMSGEKSSLDINSFSEGQSVNDRGYFVEADEYVDDYVLGSTTDFSYDELAMPKYDYYGSEDAAEIIDFQLPGQSTQPSSDHTEHVDSEDGSVEIVADELGRESATTSDKQCSGCGAQLQSENSSLPGFLPEEQLEKSSRKRSHEHLLCRRCHLLKHYNFVLNVNVCEVDYVSIMSCLRMNEEALVLLVLDITDIPGSIHRQLPHIIGSHKPMIVIANKVDLLPPDARTGYLKRFREVVWEAIEAAGFRKHFTILHTALVSAKTGYGIEDLITEIYLKYTSVKLGVRSDIYLIGCTNAGKSSLFNALLQSDLCKIRAVDVIERATTSIWPGTTLSLLKFPVMQPSPYRLELRRRRLLTNRAWLQKEMYNRKLMLQQSGNPKYAVLFGNVENTFKERDDELQPIAISDLTSGNLPENTKGKKWRVKDLAFEKGMWCYDTPGTINDQQVLNIFTLDELIHVLPRRMLRPRTALVPVGYSLIIGGIARVDVLKCAGFNSVLLTSFASDDLPLNCIPTDEAEAFLKEGIEHGTLVVPRGGKRPNEWPSLLSREFHLEGKKGGGGVADVVLSSIGWVLVSTTSPHVHIRCHTPGGKGLATRIPLLPHAASLRGKRIAGTRFYKVRPVEFPVNIRRIRANRRKRISKDF